MKPIPFSCHAKHCEHVVKKQRTLTQNAALHLWFQLVADELNAAGYTVQLVLKEKMELDWDARSVKEILWRSAQKKLLGKESTTELTKQLEIDRVYEHLNRHLGEKFGIHIEFPNNPDKEQEKNYLDAPPLNIKYEDHSPTVFD